MMIFAVKAEQFTNSATRWCLIMMIFLQQYVIAGGALDWDLLHYMNIPISTSRCCLEMSPEGLNRQSL